MKAAAGMDINLWKRLSGVVPEEVWDQVEARTLVLADNGLTEISPRIGEFGRLRMLDLGHNLLASAARGDG